MGDRTHFAKRVGEKIPPVNIGKKEGGSTTKSGELLKKPNAKPKGKIASKSDEEVADNAQQKGERRCQGKK